MWSWTSRPTADGKMLKLREELLAAEEERMAGIKGCTIDELNAYLDDIIKEV